MDDFLVYNAKIWTSAVDTESTWMVFNQSTGFIKDIGSIQPPVKKYGDRTKDYKGRRIFPGFHDTHIHLCLFSKKLSQLDVKESNSVEELLTMVGQYIKENPTQNMYLVNNINQERQGRYPTKEELDAICFDKPVMLQRICVHAAVVNSCMLEILNVNSGKWRECDIVRYGPEHPKAGEPTGLIKEDACNFCRDYINSKVTKEQNVQFIKDGLDYCLKQGITAVHPNEADLWSEYKHMAETNQLPIRVFYVPFFYDRNKVNFPKYGEQYGKFLEFADRVKLFSDGSIGAKSAALSMPYVGTEDEYGYLQYSQEELESLVSEAIGMGFRLEIHVIGDAAADSVLTALQNAGVSPEKRTLITHSQILRPDQLERMKKCGAVANIQPQMTNSDGSVVYDRLPEKLLPSFNPWKSILNHGIVCAGGSDAPIEEPKPLLGIYDAIHRKVGDRKTSTHVFMNKECVSVTEAIDMYTRGGAYATMQDHRLGKLLPGYQADFVVIDSDKDPVENPESFLTAVVAEVWVAGQQKL